jgi:hypothetical protein
MNRMRLNVIPVDVASLLPVSPSSPGSLSGSIWRKAYENLPTTTYSSPQAFPSSLRSKRALVQNTTTEEQAAKSKDTIVSYIKLIISRANGTEWRELSEMLETGFELLYYATPIRRWGVYRFLRGKLDIPMMGEANVSVSNAGTNTLKTIRS